MLFRYLAIILLIANVKNVKAGYHQKLLLDKLFKNYNKFERPVANDSESLKVSVGLAVQQIVDVDEKKQTIFFSGWLDITWKDYNLRWDPSEFGNISTIRIMSDQIWTPDLLLYNSADDSFDTTSRVNAVVSFNGEVNYLPPGMFKSTCPIVIEDFPFDEQICELKFGSWTYDEDTINLTNKSEMAQLDSYIKNGEWFLTNVTSYSKSIKYECCPTKYPFVMFVINMRRRTLYFIVNLIFPCVLISFMSVLGFSLPPDSGEKIGLEITTLLSIMMFSQLITNIIPESSLSIPKIALYFSSVMVISSMSIIANVLVLIFHHRNVKIQKPMPKWVEILICRFLAKLLGMKSLKREESKKERKLNLLNTNNHHQHHLNYSASEMNDLNSKSLLANVLDINDDFIGNNNNTANKRSFRNRLKSKILNETQANNNYTNYMSGSSTNSNFIKPGFLRENSNLSQSGTESQLGDNSFLTTYSKSEVNMVKKSLNSILKEIRQITQKLREDEDDEAKSLNWKFAAMVIDRLCMVIFTVATFLSAVLILFTSKNIFKPSNPDPIF